MHSKILNLKSSDTRSLLTQTENRYLNSIGNYYTTILPIQRVFVDSAWYNLTTTEQANYPISNLTNSNFSITNETKINTVINPVFGTRKMSGITISMTAPFGVYATYNNIAIMFNKLNTNYMSRLKTDSLQLVFRHKTVEANSKFMTIRFNSQYANVVVSNTSGTTLFTTDFYAPSIDNGMVLLDETIMYNIFGTENVNKVDYHIDIFIDSPSSASEVFAISNVFIGNSINFYAEENLNYKKKNLNQYKINKRTGKTFTQINSNLKELKIKYSNLLNEDVLNNAKNFYDLNKDAPMLVFPFNNYNENYTYNLDSLNWQKLNYELGGMYYISNDLDITNNVFDSFEYELELVEYK